MRDQVPGVEHCRESAGSEREPISKEETVGDLVYRSTVRRSGQRDSASVRGHYRGQCQSQEQPQHWDSTNIRSSVGVKVVPVLGSVTTNTDVQVVPLLPAVPTSRQYLHPGSALQRPLAYLSRPGSPRPALLGYP